MVSPVPIGAGKSHQIKLQIKNRGLHSVTIAVNEAFTVETAISKLHSLPRQEGCAIIFNFTMVPPHVSSNSIFHMTSKSKDYHSIFWP